ncbi:hypothetical protein SAMN06298216_3852 [Spirosomataceae bacterium TFI 002]|nr:hypothetical protein SAMN06298216_3852 [Spirosomataceae bacterium TFI 002]
MKNLLISFLTIVLTGCATTQKPATVVPTTYDISYNLDLEAVASIFGESRNLEDFEYRLNDPQLKISNLDLNEDGYVDYLRVVETIERGTHYIAIQAALGNDLFQDVATIDVERDSYNKPQIQFIGHPYFYGPSYIIQPLYYSTPVIVSSFWGPSYVVWRSPYYFGSYPSYYSYWRPTPVRQYVTHVKVYKNVKNTYKYVPTSNRTAGSSITRDLIRNDYVSKRPTQSFETRNKDIRNKQDLEARRSTTSSGNTRTSTPQDRTRDASETEDNSRNSTPRTSPSTRERNPTSTPSTRTPKTTPSTRTPKTTPSTRTPKTTPSTRKSGNTPSTRTPSNSTPTPRSNTEDPKNN